MIENDIKLTKEKTRRIWTIIALSNCEKWTQDELVKEMNNISEKIHHYSNEEENELNESLLLELRANKIKIEKPQRQNETQKINKMTKPIISKILKSLSRDNLISKNIIENEKKGRDYIGYSLLGSYKNLYKILTEFLDPEIEQYISSEFASMIMESQFVKNIVNHKLLDELDQKYAYEFSKNEKEMVLEIIKISPRALYITLKELVSIKLGFVGEPSFESVYGSDKNIFFFQLQLKVGEDIMYLTPLNSKKVEYNMSLKIGNLNNGDSDKIKSIIAPKSKENSHSMIFSNRDLSPV